MLLATDAAGEGLNLQERCRLVVNVELPWNPQRLEQRIGRVDRLGQRRRVHALHLFHRGSFEDEVLVRLQRRMETAAHELDRLAIDEHRVAAAVFDGLPLPEGPTRAPSPPARVAASDRAAAVTLRRRAQAIATSTVKGASPVCAAPARGRRLSNRFALLFELDVHDGGGRLAARELLPLVVELWRRVRVDGANVRQFSARLASSPGVHAILDRQVAALLVSTRAELGRTAAAVERRLLAMADRIEREPPALVQASLFDRRAERVAGARDATIAGRRAHVQQRLADVRTLSPIDASAAVRLIAVWQVD